MELQFINIKLYLENDSKPGLRDFVPVFHNWIQTQRVDELLIDVADYTHVPGGPGVLLIGHEADYGVENGSEQRFGLVYRTRAELRGSNETRIHHALRQTFKAAVELEQERRAGLDLRFSGSEIRLTANRRLLAPNSAATLDKLTTDLRTVFDTYFGDAGYELAMVSTDARERFAVTVRSKNALTARQLLALTTETSLN